MLTSKCGRATNAKGKPFTEETLRQHESDCYRCLGKHRPKNKKRIVHDEADDIDPFGIIGDDESDGVFWAMHNEYYGWP